MTLRSTPTRKSAVERDDDDDSGYSFLKEAAVVAEQPAQTPAGAIAERPKHPPLDYTRPPIAKYQLEAIFTPKRYGLIEASTKAGKTAACLVWLLEQAMGGRDGWNYWWVAPVYAQAKIAFRRMKRAIPKSLYKHNESELSITLITGAVMTFKSAEKPDNLYGDDVYAAVMDEASRTKAESWYAIRSTLTATRGPIRIIGNVKGRKNWAYKMARTAELGHPEMSFRRITAVDAIAAGVISAAEVEDARNTLPANVFKELYMAEAAEDEGRVYSAFQYAYNISSDAVDPLALYSAKKRQENPDAVLVGMDFNVNPMTAVIGSRIRDNLHIWAEAKLPNSNTERMAEHLRALIGPERHIIVYPDASGNSRSTKTPVGQTDFTILREHGFEVIAPAANPPVVDRINEVNGLLCSSSGIRRLLIHPNCTNLIEALDGLVWADSGGIDKSMGFDHITDALGYLVHCEFPINSNALTSQRLGI